MLAIASGLYHVRHARDSRATGALHITPPTLGMQPYKITLAARCETSYAWKHSRSLLTRVYDTNSPTLNEGPPTCRP